MEIYKDAEGKTTHYAILTISETEMKQLIESCEWGANYWANVRTKDILDGNYNEADVSYRIYKEHKDTADRLRQLRHKAFDNSL